MSLQNVSLSDLFLQSNKRRLYKYVIHKSYLAGLVLPSKTAGKILTNSYNLVNSYIKGIQNELFLLNFLDQKVKLLLNKREINQILELSNKERCVILPGNLLIRNRRIKVEVHLCKYNREAEKDKSKKKYRRSKFKRELGSDE